MSPTDTIVGSVIIMIGTSMIKDAHKGKPKMQPVVLGFMLGSALLLLSFASPLLAKWLAIMGVVGSLTVNGPEVLKTLGAVK